MTRELFLAAACFTLLVSRTSSADPSAMARSDIIALAQTGMGYSYYWGGGAWRSDGQDTGTCDGSCPSCSHSGSFGADCSGFVAKVWQVPGPVDLESDSHPYTSYDFTYGTDWWSPIASESAQPGDVFAYNSGGAGHVFIYESGDPWGDVWAYECKGCATGCVHDLRTVPSYYGARQRAVLSDTPMLSTVPGSDGGTQWVDPGELSDAGSGTVPMTTGDVGDGTDSTVGQSVGSEQIVATAGCVQAPATLAPAALLVLALAAARKRARR